MIFLQPAWFIIIIPVLWFTFYFKPQSRLVLITRIILSILIISALAKPLLTLNTTRGTLIILADRSASMPTDSKEKQKEIISIIEKNQPANSKYAIISFAQDSYIEKNPNEQIFKGFVTQNKIDQTNINDALQCAYSLIPQNASGRVLLLSDGCYTGINPSNTSSIFASKNIPIDYRIIRRNTTNDISIQKISAPAQVTIRENFNIITWIKAPLKTEINFIVYKKNKIFVKKTVNLSSGMNRISFVDTVASSGLLEYNIQLEPKDFKDSTPENNKANIIIQTKGEKPILHITDKEKSNFSEILKKSGIKIHTVKPELITLSLTELSAYSGIIIENVSANEIGNYGMTNISNWVKETGAGLLMTGGKNSYAVGGYFNSPLDEILPVSMELKQEHRKFKVAIVTVLDRSGSMSIRTPSGKTKMDLANISTAQVFSLLSPIDEFGVIAVDSIAHNIINLNTIQNLKGYAKHKILKMQSMGGGIFIYEALLSAVKMIDKAQSETKHVILFADAADSDAPGDFRNLLKKATDAGITVSVIGLGKPSDCDAELLREIAKLGKGECYFTENAEELPRLFAQDTFIVARTTFIEEKVKVNFTADSTMISSRNFGRSFSVGGYNLCYLKPDSNIAAVSLDEYNAPITAFKIAGSGRVMCYTGEVDGKFSEPANKWKYCSEYYASLVSWIAAAQENLPENMVITQHTEKNVNIIELFLDPDRKNPSFFKLPYIKTITENNNGKIKTLHTKMKWRDADSLYAEIPITSNSINFSTVYLPEIGAKKLPPVSLIYSPEFKIDIKKGLQTLTNLAKSTKGKARDNIADIWNDMPETKQNIPIATWLILIALCLFFFEILERRLSVFYYLLSVFNLKKIINIPFTKEKTKTLSTEKTAVNKIEKTNIKNNSKPKQNLEDKTENKEVKKQALSNALKKAKELTKK